MQRRRHWTTSASSPELHSMDCLQQSAAWASASTDWLPLQQNCYWSANEMAFTWYHPEVIHFKCMRCCCQSILVNVFNAFRLDHDTCPMALTKVNTFDIRYCVVIMTHDRMLSSLAWHFSWSERSVERRACNRSIAFGSELAIERMMRRALEVTRPQAAPHLLCWRPQAATFVMVLSKVHIVAATAILVLHVGTTGRQIVGRTIFGFQFYGLKAKRCWAIACGS